MPLRGPFRYSQRSGHLQTRFAQTMQVPSSERCSVAQHVLMAGGYHTARPLRGPRPGCSFAALTSRGLGLPHPSRLTSHPSQGHGTPCHYTSLLKPHSYDLTPHSSSLTPHSSLLAPHSSLLTPHSSPAKPVRSHDHVQRMFHKHALPAVCCRRTGYHQQRNQMVFARMRQPRMGGV